MLTVDQTSRFPFGCERVAMNPRARELVDYLFGPKVPGSNLRARHLCRKLIGEPTHVFWPVFLETWSACDCPWPDKAVFLDLLRRHSKAQHARAYFEADAASLFDTLPDLVQVYRGAGRRRARGLSWSIEASVAERFAKGLRYDCDGDRVLAAAVVPKDAIFAVIVDRKESEIVLDPRRLRKLKLEARSRQFAEEIGS